MRHLDVGAGNFFHLKTAFFLFLFRCFFYLAIWRLKEEYRATRSFRPLQKKKKERKKEKKNNECKTAIKAANSKRVKVQNLTCSCSQRPLDLVFLSGCGCTEISVCFYNPYCALQTWTKNRTLSVNYHWNCVVVLCPHQLLSCKCVLPFSYDDMLVSWQQFSLEPV